MEHHARWLDWMSNPIAERMSFSSFSHSVDDIWAYDVARPYQIVLKPGYRVAEGLDCEDKDALIYARGEVGDRPVIAWDGFSAIALFEIIRECFDYTGTDDRIVVRDARSGKVVRDPRDPEVMKLRPSRQAGWGPRRIKNHIAELMIWSGMFPAGNETSDLYAEMLSPDAKNLTDSVDSFERAELFVKMGMKDVDAFENQNDLLDQHARREIRLHSACRRGPAANTMPSREETDDEVPMLDLSFHGMSDLARLRVSDFPNGAPDSYYRFALKKGLSEMNDRRQRAAVNNGPIEAEISSAESGADYNRDDNPF